jgi:polygalacturonase
MTTLIPKYDQGSANAVNRPISNKLAESVSVKDFGAVGDGTTNDTVAIQSAINATLGTSLYFPEGQYKVTTTLNITSSINIVGASVDGVRIVTNNASSDVFYYTGTSRLTVRNITFASSVTKTGGAYINLYSGFQALIERCVFENSYTAINTVNASGWTIANNYFPGYTNGVIVQNVGTPDEGDSTIYANIFDANNTTGVAIHQFSSGGLRITNNKILAGSYHYLGEYSTAPNQTSVLLINNNSMEAASVSLISFGNSNNTGFSYVNISNNELAVNSNANAIVVTNFGTAYLDGMYIGGNLIILVNNSNGIVLGSARRACIGPNNFIGQGTGEIGITLASTLVSATVYPQEMDNIDTQYSIATTNATFLAGYTQKGTISGTANTTYGSLYITSFINVTFATPFPVVPKVSANCNNTNAGQISVILGTITTTGFTAAIVGNQNGGALSAAYVATL